MKLVVGQKVKFLNEDLHGEIITVISEDLVEVDCSDGFSHQVAVHEIIIVGDDNQHLYKVKDNIMPQTTQLKQVVREDNGLLKKYMDRAKYKYEGVLEIDLHLEELVEFPGKLDDWQRLHTQIQHVKNCLNAALDKNIKRIVFIHGVGTGVLKAELHNYLAGFDNLVLKDADFREYGVGATEVIIK